MISDTEQMLKEAITTLEYVAEHGEYYIKDVANQTLYDIEMIEKYGYDKWVEMMEKQ